MTTPNAQTLQTAAKQLQDRIHAAHDDPKDRTLEPLWRLFGCAETLLFLHSAGADAVPDRVRRFMIDACGACAWDALNDLDHLDYAVTPAIAALQWSTHDVLVGTADR